MVKRRGSTMPRNSIPDHRNVYEAIAAADAEAARQAMRNLVDLALADARLVLHTGNEQK